MPVRIDGDVVNLTAEDTMIGADVFRFTAEGDHAAFLHDPAGVGIAGVVFGGDAVEVAGFKQVADHPFHRLGGKALVPPGLTNAVGQLHTGEQVIGVHAADAADGLAQVLGHNEPLVEVVLLVAIDPELQHLPGDVRAAVGGPHEIFGDLRVRGPVVKHGLGILSVKIKRSASTR